MNSVNQAALVANACDEWKAFRIAVADAVGLAGDDPLGSVDLQSSMMNQPSVNLARLLVFLRRARTELALSQVMGSS
jgi:hypothetical protein